MKCAEDYQETAIDRADVIMSGSVVRVEGRTVVFDVLKSYKGQLSGEVSFVVRGFKGGMRFELHQGYLTFASRHDDGLEVGDCSGTLRLADASALIDELEGAPRPVTADDNTSPAAATDNTSAPARYQMTDTGGCASCALTPATTMSAWWLLPLALLIFRRRMRL